MKRLILIAALSLGGCAALQTATTPVPAPTMATLAKDAYAARSGYLALLVVAEAYNKRPACGGTVIICRDPVVIDQIRKASAAADAGTLAGENAVRTLGANPLVAQAAVVAATQATAAFKSITDVYGAK